MAEVNHPRVLKPWRASEAKPRKWIGVLGVLTLMLIWQSTAIIVADPLDIGSSDGCYQAFLRNAGTAVRGKYARMAFDRQSRALSWRLWPCGRDWRTAGFDDELVPAFDAVVTPFFNLFRFIAPIAWVPFAVLWFGTGLGGPLLIIFSGAFAPCVIGSYEGGKLTDMRLLEAARTFGASGLRSSRMSFCQARYPRSSRRCGWQPATAGNRL